MKDTTKKRTTIYLTAAQKERLAFYSERTGAPVATLIRRAINESLAKLDTSPQPHDLVATLIHRAIDESLAKLDTSPQPRDTATQK